MFFYAYTIVLLLVCTISATVCISAYLVSHNQRYVPESIFFLSYFGELSLIFGTEWAVQNTFVVSYSNYYEVDMPYIRIPLGAIILAGIWMTVCNILDMRDKKVVIIPTISLCIAQSLILLFMPYSPLRQWAYYSMRQISLICCLGFAAHVIHTSSDKILQQRIKKRKNMFYTLVIFVFCIFCEDTIVILIAPIPDANNNLIGLLLSSRNFSENAMMLYIAWKACRTAIDDLELRYNRPPEKDASDNEKLFLTHIQDRLPAYTSKYNLSSRESEILEMLLKGFSNREIASKLYLAEGTVKTHVHNIIKKCKKDSRKDLESDFWAS
jgi:DNA-binding CsgD family transcriptional regulator